MSVRLSKNLALKAVVGDHLTPTCPGRRFQGYLGVVIFGRMSAWAVGRPARLGLLSGAFFGLWMGVFYAFKEHSPYGFLVGVPTGVFFGLTMGYFFKRRGSGPTDLNRDQGRKVIAAVRRGERVDDPILAAGVVELADVVIRRQPLERYTLLIFGAFALLSLGLVIVDLVGRDLGGAGWYFLSLMLWVAACIWWPRWRRRQVEHAQQARAHAISLT